MPRHSIPDTALHAHYANTGGHADCYAADVPAPVSLADFVLAFYTSPLFRLERWVLAVVLGMPSTDAEARAVAVGDAPFDRPGAKGCDAAWFAAWTVEARSECQLVMCDHQGRTRSWFMVEKIESGPSTSSGRADVRGTSVRLSSGQKVTRTRVYFGTAIAAARSKQEPSPSPTFHWRKGADGALKSASPRPSPVGGRGGRRIPFAFRALMPFHRLYSRALLWSAVRGSRAG